MKNNVQKKALKWLRSELRRVQELEAKETTLIGLAMHKEYELHLLELIKLEERKKK